MSNLGLLSEAEDIQFNQQCALTTLGIIQSSLEQEVTHIEASGASRGGPFAGPVQRRLHHLHPAV